MRYDAGAHGPLAVLQHEVRAALARADAHADPALEAGKRANVALAARAFDGLALEPGRPLSFWRTLGRPSQRRGFTFGMELRGGCVVPSIGGGLCLLSNALFELAVRAGWRIDERHGHSLEAIPPPPGSVTLDATVAWPDVDLVVAPPERARLVVAIDGDALVVSAFGARSPACRVELAQEEQVEARGDERVRRARVVRRRLDGDGRVVATDEVARGERRILAPEELGRTCLSCGETACQDRPAAEVLVMLGRR